MEERTTLYQKALRGAVVGWRGTALPSRGGCHVRLSSWAAFSHPASAGWEFLFFARHVFFFVALGKFLFNDGHIQNISLFDIFIRERMPPISLAARVNTGPP